jgi:hypothetical protein
MDSKHYNVYVDPEADRKMAAHMEFLARVSEAAAMRLYDDYKEALGFIEGSAEGCPIYASHKLAGVQLRYWLFGRRYRIIFEIIGADVFAYDIQDCRQDTDKGLV